MAATRLRQYSLTCGAMARQALPAKPRQRPLDVLINPSRATTVATVPMVSSIL